MPVGTHFLLQHGYEVNGISCSNTYVCEMVDPAAGADETNACATAFAASLLGEIRDIQSNQTAQCFLNVHDLESGQPPTLNLIVNTFGAVLGDALPANKNAKVLMRQAVFSARTNGEIRIAGIPESDSDGNNYLGIANHPVAVANIVRYIEDGFPDLAGPAGRYRVKIASSGLEAQGNPPIPNYLDVTQAEMRSLIYSDRRRTSRHMSLVG